jgi:hypothetical protein
MATKYDVSCLPIDHRERHHFTIYVEWRGPDLWAVTTGFGDCLGVDGEWDYERSPSNRGDNWKATHRYDLDTALRLAKEQAPLMTCNRWTVEEAIARENKR